MLSHVKTALVVLIAGTLTLAIVALDSGTADARMVRVADALDTPPGLDVSSVTYRNQESAAGATVRVRNLHRAGSMQLRIGPPNSDVLYYVTVWPRASGSVGQRLEYSTNTSTEVRACRFDATWSAPNDVISVSVPHTCLSFGRFLTHEWFRATMRLNGRADVASGVVVGRGSSPGCASVAEIRSVRNGLTRRRVNAILDTSGRFGDGGAGGYSYVYRNCGGGRGWYVEYEGDTGRVIGKGRVRSS
jgi:hypothetical protein